MPGCEPIRVAEGCQQDFRSAGLPQMTLAFFIAFLSLAALVVVLLVTWGYSKSVSGLEDLTGRTRPVDIEAFRNIIDPGEEEFLRANLPAREFRAVQRQRLLAAAEYVHKVAYNAAVLLKLGQAATHSTDPSVAAAARQLMEHSLRLRIYAVLSLLKLYVKIALPEARLSSGSLAENYQQLSSLLGHLALRENPARAARLSGIL
jgi:hypothetical protein